VKRGTTVPTNTSKIFSTYDDDQSSVFIQVYEGEGIRTKDNICLCSFELSGIPPAPRGVPQIEITFDIDSNSVLNVSATDRTTGRSKRITVINEGSRPKDEIEYMLDEFEKYKADDEAAAARSVIAKNALKLYLDDLRNFINNDKLKLETAVNETISWLDTSTEGSMEEFQEKLKELEAIANPIAQKLYGIASISNESQNLP
jgi:L1 cell adhesion molecule like protein